MDNESKKEKITSIVLEKKIFFKYLKNKDRAKREQNVKDRSNRDFCQK